MSRLDALGNTCTHKVRIHLRRVAPGPPMFELNAVRDAQRVFGAHGICIELASRKNLSLTSWERERFEVFETPCRAGRVVGEQTLLYGRGSLGVGMREILVYWVGALEWEGESFDGCGAHGGMRPAIALRRKALPWTLAHEIGHVLLGPRHRPVHVADPGNLMHSYGGILADGPPILTDDQATVMRASRYSRPI